MLDARNGWIVLALCYSPSDVRTQLQIPLAALLGLAAILPNVSGEARAYGRTDRPDVLSVSDLKKGMKGYGMTVFEGTKPERFDVEIIDILRDFRPRQELILVKTPHPRLEVAKIVGGMSGSPIYFNGKMAGAYSYGWSFGVEPVAGVTPIRNMLDDLERPLPKTLRGSPLGVLPSKDRLASLDASRVRSGNVTNARSASRATAGLDAPRTLDAQYDLEAHAAALAKRAPRGASRLEAVSTPLMMGGLSEGSLEVARQLLEPLGVTPLQAGGGNGRRLADDAQNDGFVDGGALGVNMVRGDVSAMGLGTVTRVEGDRLVAFGHPMMHIGVTALPTTQARVLWFMASQARSFKMGEATMSRGVLVNDRQASIVVHQDKKAITVPVSVKIDGEPGAPFTDWNFDVAHDAFVTPTFLAVGIGNALESAAAERRDINFTIDARVKFRGYPEVLIEDFGAVPTGTPRAQDMLRSNLVKGVGAVFNNQWEHVRLEKVDVQVKLDFARDVALLRGVELLTPAVDPGGEARLRVTLEPFEGKRQTRVVAVRIPEHLAGESVKLTLRPGYEVHRVRPEPESVGELLANMQNPTETHRSLVVSYNTGEGGAAHRGHVAESLPPGALDLLTSESSSIAVAQFATQQHEVVSLPFYLVGKDHVTVKVRETPR